jgi:hypothetical protein
MYEADIQEFISIIKRMTGGKEAFPMSTIQYGDSREVQ